MQQCAPALRTPARRPIANANAFPPGRLSAPSEYTPHSGSRRRLPQASYSWSVRQDHSTSASCVRRKEPPHCPGLLAQASAGAPRCGVCSRCLPSLSPQRSLLLFGAARHAAQICCSTCKVETPALPSLPALPAPSPPPVSSCPLSRRRPQLSPYPKPLPPYPDEASLRHTPRTPMRPLFPDVNSTDRKSGKSGK